MDKYEKFISNPDQLKDIFQKIRAQEIPNKFNQNFLSSLSIEEPNSILYVRLFKNLGLVTEDERPHPTYYPRFMKSEEQAKRLIARQMKSTVYAKIFEADNNAHHLSKEEIRSLFQELMGPKKSETIVRLAADTFSAIAQYADWQFESHGEESGKSEELEGRTNGNGNIKKATTPHEEFILELINGESHHKYKRGDTAVDNIPDNEDQQTEPDRSEATSDNKQEIYSAEISESRKQNHTQEQSPKNHNGQNKNNKEVIDIYVQALQRKAELLERLERITDAVQAYDSIIYHADEDEYPIDAENVLSAYYKKASLLDNMQNYEEALVNYDHLIQRFQ